MWLTCCPARYTFSNHVKKAYMKTHPNKLSSQTKDTIRISRDEGGRVVNRKVDIYDLAASCSIIDTFGASDFSDYGVVSGRFRGLLAQFRQAQINSMLSVIKEKNNGAVPPFIDLDNPGMIDMDLLELIAGDDYVVAQKARQIVDYVDGRVIHLMEGDEVAIRGGEVRQIRFRERV